MACSAFAKSTYVRLLSQGDVTGVPYVKIFDLLRLNFSPKFSSEGTSSLRKASTELSSPKQFPSSRYRLASCFGWSGPPVKVRLQRPLCLHCGPLLRSVSCAARFFFGGKFVEKKLRATCKVPLSNGRRHQFFFNFSAFLVRKMEKTPTVTKILR